MKNYWGAASSLFRNTVLLSSLFLCAIVWTSSFTTVAIAQNTTPELFTGERRVFVANGYSTTRNWPNVLQRKVNKYYNGEQVIEVINTYESGTPIAKWIDVNTGERLSKWKKNLQPALESETEFPVILLAQQSLQWVFGDDRTEGVSGPNDTARINQGADAIALFNRLAQENGADLVFMATHIYKKVQEPQIENEKYALDVAVKRTLQNFHAGPDVWTPTFEHFSVAYARDEIHPGPIGDEIIAQYWFARLMEFDGKTVPAWSIAEMETAIINGGGDIGRNRKPTADLKADPVSGPAPLTVTFDGSGSVDTDGELVAHDWSYPDGTNDAGEVVTKTFTEPGTYEVNLLVADERGDTDTATITITVSESSGIAYGDPTGDGTVSALDASEILSHVVGLSVIDSQASIRADVSGNGALSALDASLVLQYTVGLISCFPVEAGCGD